MGRGGRISCEVTGRRKHGKGLEVPCIYTITGREKKIVKLKDVLRAKSGHSTKPLVTTIKRF